VKGSGFVSNQHRHALYYARVDAGLTREELADLTGLSLGTIWKIETKSSEFKTNRKVAELLAEALELPVRELFDSHELSHLGRPPLTGRPIGSSTAITVVQTTTVMVGSNEALCTCCYLVVPCWGGECDNCGAQLQPTNR
jgi:DNA-binding XRE family transcriptional regulator